MTRKLYCQNSIFKRHTRYHIYPAAACILLALICFATLSSAVLPTDAPTISDLTKLISENEDIHINVNDLAYFLVIHDFDARPVGDHVELTLNGTTYELVPNGPYPGLANITGKS